MPVSILPPPPSGGGVPVGSPNSLAYYNPLGTTVITDPALTAAPIDQYGRPQILDRRLGTPPAANCVWRQGGWQVDGDPVNQSGDGIVIYGPAANNLQNALNGAFGRMKWDRFAIRYIIGGVDIGYAWRTDVTEQYFKNDSGIRTWEVTRATGNQRVGGDLSQINAGNRILLKEGVNAMQGLGGPLAGAPVVIPNTLITPNTRIMITAQDGGAPLVGSLYVAARIPGASFMVASTAIEAGVLFAWQLWEPAP